MTHNRLQSEKLGVLQSVLGLYYCVKQHLLLTSRSALTPRLAGVFLGVAFAAAFLAAVH